MAMRSKSGVDWDPVAETTSNEEAKSFLRKEYRSPWKLEF